MIAIPLAFLITFLGICLTWDWIGYLNWVSDELRTCTGRKYQFLKLCIFWLGKGIQDFGTFDAFFIQGGWKRRVYRKVNWRHLVALFTCFW